MQTLKPTHDITPTYRKVKEIIEAENFSVYEEDLKRPWGGFIRLNDGDAERFINKYFPDLQPESYENMSPKFLMVAPGMRLSWQEHDRRAEVWRVLEGPVAVKISETPEEPAEKQVLQTGDFIEFDANVCHRLIGEDGWGVVTEIWVHTDPSNPSNEDDITRHQDDFKR